MKLIQNEKENVKETSINKLQKICTGFPTGLFAKCLFLYSPRIPLFVGINKPQGLRQIASS